ncbi:hypothetical protein ACFWPX_30075 [Nocardia sp. NPDC058518]|uniref:hypothetical protein n=1 Tax=Nocardia sp. NPDC058518 TaxID=3346534 RepID=UPI00365E1A9D
MPAPRSLYQGPRPHFPPAPHRADHLAQWGICDHCEGEMEDQILREEWNALPAAERIATRWARARHRIRSVGIYNAIPF